MSNKRNLFSVTDNGEGIEIKCEAEMFEICSTFSALYKTSPAFRAIIETSVEMAKRNMETGLKELNHNEQVIWPNKTQGDA
jgi:hypothetical protein